MNCYPVCPLCNKQINGMHRLVTHLCGQKANGGHEAK